LSNDLEPVDSKHIEPQEVFEHWKGGNVFKRKSSTGGYTIKRAVDKVS